MQFAIIGYGDYTHCPNLLAKYDYVIAADGGANHCQRMKITPDAVIGDGDSISALGSSQSNWHAAPDQNQSDLGKAITLAQHVAGDKPVMIDLFSVTSGARLDHTLTAVMQLLHSGIIRAIYTPQQALHFCREEFMLDHAVGTVVSIVPTTSQATVTITGCKWSGQNIRLDNMRSGLSNIVIDATASITVQSGAVLLIHSQAYS